MFKQSIIALCLGLAAIPCDGQENGNQLPILAKQSKLENVFIAETEHGTLTIQVESPIVYLPKDGKATVDKFLSAGLVNAGKKVEQKGGFFDTKPAPTKIKRGSSIDYTLGSEILGRIEFGKPGTISVVTELGTEKICVPIEVKQLPYSVGMDSDALVLAMGLPKSNNQYFISWPENKFIEGVFYSVSASESIYSVEHWKFDQLPNCIFSIKEGKIRGVHSRFEAQPSKPTVEPKPAQPSIPTVERDFKGDTFILSDGKTLKAKFIDIKKSKVILEDVDGKTFEYKLADFDKSSSAKIRELFKRMPKEPEPKKKK